MEGDDYLLLHPAHPRHGALTDQRKRLLFYTNYAIVVLVVVFLNLLWWLGSLIVFVFMMGVWLYLYFLCDKALVVKGYAVDECVILVVLSIFTTVLLLTTATVNVVSVLAVGTAVVVAHRAFSADIFAPEMMDQEEGRGVGGSRLLSKMNLMETASSSFSS